MTDEKRMPVLPFRQFSSSGVEGKTTYCMLGFEQSSGLPLQAGSVKGFLCCGKVVVSSRSSLVSRKASSLCSSSRSAENSIFSLFLGSLWWTVSMRGATSS